MEERLKVKYVSIDLSASFRKMVQECFPNARIAADHFHAVRMANDALDNVRKEVQSGLGQECRKYFKHSRKVLLKREKDLTEEERHVREVLLNHSDRLSAAYAMKEAYFKIFESKDGTEFSRRLRQFAEAAEKQAIKGFQTNGAMEKRADLRNRERTEQRVHGRMQYDHQDVETGMLRVQEF